ncbi:MAG: hypothetical protein E2O54_08850 [Gammaproteobacteria bacterium]|nr:MAG: hypothetical protein E2O58_01965 [Gammaproteobacteria bacterium]TDJ40071.1 MAG: hypothetical protein E2O54_08850 [Gammaproteobacteria bacterium]
MACGLTPRVGSGEMPGMSISSQTLAEELAKRFRPQAAQGLRMDIRLAIGGSDDVFLALDDGHLDVGLATISEPDVSFLFSDMDTAWRILSGRENAIDAFMQGRFRADGYLMMAFKLMEIFGSLSLPPTPND